MSKHHVQNLLGYSDRVQNARQRASKTEANKLSVRLELHADYLADVWAHHAIQARRFLVAGDIEAAFDAATAIGDDKLQKQACGYVVFVNSGRADSTARTFRVAHKSTHAPAVAAGRDARRGL